MSDAVSSVASDPSLVATPAGIAVLVGTALVGFGARQSASVAKWAGAATAGPLMKLVGKLFKKES